MPCIQGDTKIVVFENDFRTMVSRIILCKITDVGL